MVEEDRFYISTRSDHQNKITLIEKHRASELWAELHVLVVIGAEV